MCCLNFFPQITFTLNNNFLPTAQCPDQPFLFLLYYDIVHIRLSLISRFHTTYTLNSFTYWLYTGFRILLRTDFNSKICLQLLSNAHQPITFSQYSAQSNERSVALLPMCGVTCIFAKVCLLESSNFPRLSWNIWISLHGPIKY